MAVSKDSNVSEIDYPGFGSFKIHSDNKTLKFRARTFLTKEPTTLSWLQSLEADSILIDVGANIGIYTIPAALFHVKKVIAIEPEIKNYNMLLRNLALNNVSSEQCEALPLAISTVHKNEFTRLYLAKDEVGSSCHQVGKNQDFKLRTIEKERKYRNVFCSTLSQILEQVAADHRAPIHVKIDVDGIEADVCQSLFDDSLFAKISSLQIELNPSLPEHNSLISALRCVGFDYDPDQVEQACRKQGVFQGYAEYVFRRYISEEAIKTLPEAIRPYLGSQISQDCLVKGDLTPQKRFFNNSAVVFAQVSRLPVAFALKNVLNYAKASQIFHQLAISALSKPIEGFQFSAASVPDVKDSLRIELSAKDIQHFSLDYWNELCEFVMGKALVESVVKSFWIAASYYYRDEVVKEGFKPDARLGPRNLVARVRHFVDLYGYSLARHHDSHDTFCAMIIPVFPYSTPTSIINGSPINRNFHSKLTPDSLREDQFSAGRFYGAVDGVLPTLTYFHDENGNKNNPSIQKKWRRESFPFSYQQLRLNPGEALLIPNPMCKVLNNSDSPGVNHMLKNCGHGVLPFVKDIYRPVIIIDFVATTSKGVEILKNKISNGNDFVYDYGSIYDICN